MGRGASASSKCGTRELKRRIEGWRRHREKRGPMPEELWSGAVGLAQSQGINPVARALRLDYYSLKKRVDGVAPQSSAPFVEVTVPRGAWGPEMVLEIERLDGSRMKVQVMGPATETVRELALAFLGRA